MTFFILTPAARLRVNELKSEVDQTEFRKIMSRAMAVAQERQPGVEHGNIDRQDIDASIETPA